MVIENISTLKTDTKSTQIYCLLQFLRKACLYSGYSRSQAQSQSAPCHFPVFVKTVLAKRFTGNIWNMDHTSFREKVPRDFVLCVRYMWWMRDRGDCLWDGVGMKCHRSGNTVCSCYVSVLISANMYAWEWFKYMCEHAQRLDLLRSTNVLYVVQRTNKFSCWYTNIRSSFWWLQYAALS